MASATSAAENAALTKTPRTGGGNPLGSGVAAPGSKLDPVTGAMRAPTSPTLDDLQYVEVTGRQITRGARGIGGGDVRYKKDELGILQFPLALEDRNLPYVLFKVFETQQDVGNNAAKSQSEASYTSGFVNFINKAKATGTALNQEVLGGFLGNAATSVATDAVNTIDKVGEEVGIGNISSQLKDAFRNFSLNRNSQQLRVAMALFMPDGLSTSYDHQYDELSLTSVLGGAGMFAQAMSTENGALKAKDPFVIEAASKLAGSIPGLSSSQELTNLLLFGSTGRTINPQMEMIYNSPRLRTFTFDFRLVPRNAAEAAQIKNIIDRFKYFAAPEIPLGTTGRYFIPPARFEIEFYHRGAKNNYLFKTKQCVLETISLDYAPNGYASHYDGAPVETRMTLGFKETTIIDKTAINEGY